MSGEPSGPWTVLKLIQWTHEYFARGEVQDPRLSTEVLLAHILGCKRIELYTRFDYEPSPDELASFRQLVTRAHQHEPVAYLVGEKEFYSLPFKVTPDVIIPRPESEILVSEGIAHLRRLTHPGAMWDVCTGSGCIAVALAVNVPDATVLGTDISPQVVAVASENATRHQVADRIRLRVADLLTLPEDCRDLKQFDVITANPPYVGDGEPVGETVKHEPQAALRGGPDGLDFIRPIIRDAPRFLTPGGVLIMEFGYKHPKVVWDLILETDCFAEPKILRDHQGIERVVVARKQP